MHTIAITVRRTLLALIILSSFACKSLRERSAQSVNRHVALFSFVINYSLLCSALPEDHGTAEYIRSDFFVKAILA